MASFNHNLSYRPLRGGVAILNPLVNKIGTLGLIAISAEGERWMLSCYHVLGRIDLSAFPGDEPIYQAGDDQVPAVAKNSTARADATLDCAAARLEPGIEGISDLLGLPPVTGLGEPVVGMRVLKSGSVTGVTEGVVTDVQGPEVTIGVATGFPATYELSAEGDSGAIWVARATGAAVALHRAGTSTGVHEARATRLEPVLAALRLRLL